MIYCKFLMSKVIEKRLGTHEFHLLIDHSF